MRSDRNSVSKVCRAWPAMMLVLLAACSPAKEERPQVPPEARAGAFTATPCVHEQGKVACRAQCGVIYVAENRADPKSRLIALPYKRVIAETKTPGEPVFILNGGPGQSNMSAGGMVPWFIGQRDVVLMGYRGVDGSARLDCPEVDEAIHHSRTFLNRDGIARVGAAYRDCAARLTAAGIDLKAYTVLETVDDIEALRRALKYPRIDLLSISYGTRLAMIYGWRYPEAVRRSAMVGVNPPGHFRFDGARFEAQIKRYGALCAADAKCAARTKDLAADIRKALANMPAHWLGIPVHRDAVAFATFMALYQTGGAASVFDMWIAAAHGDYSGMALVSAVYPLMIPHDMAWGEFAAKGGSVDFDPDPAADPVADIAPGRHLLGAPVNILGWAAMGNWPVEKIPAIYRRMQPSAVETLLVSGSLDPATPFEAARDDVLPLFPNADQVVLKEFAHAGDLLNAESDASRHLLAGFFATGNADASHFAYRPVRFDPGWMSFPLIAKLLLGGVAVALALLGLLARWLIRRARTQRKGARAS